MSEKQDDFLENVLVPALLVSTCVPAIICNSLVLLVLRCSPRMRQTSSNNLVFSLALADLFHVVTYTPTKIIQYRYKEAWVWGDWACRATIYFKDMSLSITQYTLVLMALNRYLAVALPSHGLTRALHRHSDAAAVAIWLLMPVANSLSFFLYGVREFVPDKGVSPDVVLTVCTFLYLESFFTYQLVLFLLFYVVPVSLISAFYVLLAMALRNQLPNGGHEAPQVTRAARIVVGFVISFVVLSTPLQVMGLCFSAGLLPNRPWVRVMSIVFQVLAQLNCIVDPLLFTFMNTSFRKEIRRLLLRRRRVQECQCQHCDELPYTETVAITSITRVDVS
ncbi:allatostatin-A receptor-like [Tropilaelaps mercedesae]|uniref:Allatostatin-A receptor-like n=1 Tax=Tropilaelaps mercedesae TaxID=418985 RepID=A0A1V9XYJ7_9ACAR|nr:allatostatin-A receptor-like [Tropilaelaps mercedesae]